MLEDGLLGLLRQKRQRLLVVNTTLVSAIEYKAPGFDVRAKCSGVIDTLQLPRLVPVGCLYDHPAFRDSL